MDDDRHNLFVVASMNNNTARGSRKQCRDTDIDARLAQVNRAG